MVIGSHLIIVQLREGSGYPFAQILGAQLGNSDMAGRFGGQRFLFMAVDSGPRAAIKAAETIRQTVEKTVYYQGETRFGITVSGAVTEVSPKDETYHDVFQRLDKSIVAAKKGGRNCLFGCQRTELDATPELIEAPSFGIEEREIEI